MFPITSDDRHSTVMLNGQNRLTLTNFGRIKIIRNILNIKYFLYKNLFALHNFV